MTDRNIIFPNGCTIFWKDLLSYLHLPNSVKDMGLLLNLELGQKKDNGEFDGKTILFAYFWQ